MPAMKLTPNAAMRARDVSRPRADQLAAAEAAEAAAVGSGRRAGEMRGPKPREGAVPGAPGHRGEGTRRHEKAAGSDAGETQIERRLGGEPEGALEGQPGQREFPRRRRGPRDPGRRGRPAR